MCSELLGLGLMAALVCAAVAEGAPEGQMLPREVRGDLPVVVGGVAQAAVVAPTDPETRRVAEDLAAWLREQTGADVPLVDDAKVVGPDGRTLSEEYRRRHLILVGNALNNRAILPLYCRWLDAADGGYPGGDGYELRTVVNPYGTGCQELVLGASSPEGARRGLEALKARAGAALQGRDLVLPQMLEVQAGPALKPAFDQAIAEVKANPRRKMGAFVTDGDLAEFCNDAFRYAWTGEAAFARRAAGILREMNRTFDGTYYHGTVRTCDDYSMEYAVRGWLLLQHAGVLTPAELHETDRNLLHDFPLSAHGPQAISSRHLASGSMAFFTLVDGLLTYGNPDAAARRTLEGWREGVRAYFRGACRAYRGDVDQAQDYGAMENVFRYAVHDGYWEYFDGGWADKTITQMLMNVDNGGYYSGIGGYGEAMPGSLNYWVAIGVALPMTAFVERRGDLRWIQENVPNLSAAHLGFIVLGVHCFDMGAAVPAVPPQGRLTGLTTLPVDEYHYQLGQQEGITEGVGRITLPRERCVDKVMLREGFGRQDQYLLLNGNQTGSMQCVDGNAIVRFCDRGQAWLFQSTQEEGHYTKNAVWVSNGRNTDLLEGCAELRHAVDLGAISFSSTLLPRYHGTDWERVLFSRRGGAFVVFDRLALGQPGPYVMACTWRSPRYARLHPDGSWTATDGSGTLTIRSGEAWAPERRGRALAVAEGRDSRQEIRLSPSQSLTCSMDDDRFSAEVPWTLRHWKRLPEGSAPGQVVEFQNVVYASAPDDPQEYALRRLGDGVAILRGRWGKAGAEQQELSLLGMGTREVGDALSVQADLSWVGTPDIAAAGLRLLRVKGRTWVECSAPADLHLRQGTGGLEGTLTLHEDAPVALSIPGLVGVVIDGGAPRAAEGGTVRLQLAKGRHTLACNGDVGPAWRELGSILESAWRSARPERPLTAARSGDARRTTLGGRRKALPVESAWSFDGLRNDARTVRGVRVSSRVDGGEERPGPQAVVGDTFNTAMASWRAARVDLTLDLPEKARIRGVQSTLYLGATDFDKERPNPMRIAGVALLPEVRPSHTPPSLGGLGRAEALTPPASRAYRYRRGFYGSAFYSEVVDRIDGIEGQASGVRLSLERPEGAEQIRLGRVQVLADGIPDSVPLKCQRVRLRGADAWAVWNPDSGRLALLDGAGRALWERDLGAAITGVACDDVDGDGRSEVAVTSADWCVRLFDEDGREVLKRDWRGEFERTGGKYYYGGTPHGVGILARPGQKAKELAVGHYYFLSYVQADGAIAKTVEGTACYWQDFLDTGVDLNGDGQPEMLVYTETPWQTRVPVVLLDGVKREIISYFPGGNGGARLLRMVKVGDEDCVALGSPKGCGLYSLTKAAYKWYLAGEVPRNVFYLTDLEGDGSPEMLVGQRDGFVLVVDAAGKVRHQWDLGEEVLAVGALPGPAGLTILASTARGTLGLDTHGRVVGELPLVAQRFEPAAADGRSALLALHADGKVELLRAKGNR